MRVAVVGCGLSPVGAGLGAEIDAHDLVIRANRAFQTAGREGDWGSRTDILCVGHEATIGKLLPSSPTFEVVYVEKVWTTYWTHPRKPLCGTFAAMHAAKIGATKVTLYGIDLYADCVVRGNAVMGRSIFRGHPATPPSIRFDLNMDRDALLNLPCKVEWRLRRL